MFFCAMPSLLPATPTSCVGACTPDPRARFVTPGNIHNPAPAAVLDTTRSPVEVIRPHCGPVNPAPLSKIFSKVDCGVAAVGSKRQTLLLAGSQTYKR